MLRPVSLLPALVAVASFATWFSAPALAVESGTGPRVTASGAVVTSTSASRTPLRAARTAARTATRTATEPLADTPLAVTINKLSPSTIPRKGEIRVSGSVTNTDDQTWTTVNLYPFVSDTPMTTSAELSEATATEPDAFVGERIIDPGPYDQIDELAPGESRQYSFAVARSRVQVDDAGVYWFGVHALGQSDLGRDDVADGRARTFLPLVPNKTESLDTALVVPVRRGVRHDAEGRITQVGRWTRTLSVDGELRSLVDFGAAAGSRPISWLVDPAVVDSVELLVAGNPARSIEPTIEQDPPQDPDASGSPESPGTDDPTDSPGDSSADPSADPSPDEEEEPNAVTAAGTAWLDRLHTGLEGNEILALPYADVDVDAAAANDPDLYRDARLRSGSELEPWGLPTSSIISSPSGYIDPAAMALADEDTTVLATDLMFRGDVRTTNQVDGSTVVAVASDTATGGPGPDDPLGLVALRQRIVSDAAVRALSPDPQPLVVVFPSTWAPGSATEFFDGLDLDWLNLTTVDAISSQPADDVDADLLRYPESQAGLALDTLGFTAASRLIQAGDTLQNLLTLNDQVGGTVRDEAYTDVSYSARVQPWRASGSANRSRGWIEQRLRSVLVDAPKAVILSSGSGRFSATVTNDLDQPVSVKLQAIADPPLKVVVPSDGVDIAPGARSTFLLNASSSAVGIRNVTLLLTDGDGVPLGASDELPIRSNRVSNVIWLILGTGVALLFGAIALRLFRRIRTAARS